MEMKIICIHSPKVSSYRVIWHQGQCLMSYKSQLNSKILWRVYSLSVHWGLCDKILSNIISISFQYVSQIQHKLQPLFSICSQNLWIFARVVMTLLKLRICNYLDKQGWVAQNKYVPHCIEASYCCQQESVGLHKKWPKFCQKKRDLWWKTLKVQIMRPKAAPEICGSPQSFI